MHSQRASELAAQVSVKLEHVDGLKFNVKLSGERKIELNSTEEMGQSFGPMELFLVSLAGCTAMDVQWIMDRQRQKVDRLEISAVGTRRDEDPKYYKTVELEYTLSGPSIRKDAVERAIRLSKDRYCSVMAMLKDVVRIDVKYRILNGTEPEQVHTLA
jgi:putative redox protein